MVDDVTVHVVGAGPTGLLLASELRRWRVGCRVIDAHPAPLHWDRATVVHPRSLEVFESLGLLEPLLATGVKQRATRLHSGGSVLGRIDLATCGSRYGFNICISEEVTESILTEYLQQQGGEVIRSSSLMGLEEHEDGLLATIQRDGTMVKVTVQWMVGCDGLHSTTRKLSGIEPSGHDITEPRGSVRCNLGGLARHLRGDLRLFGRDSGNPDLASGKAMASICGRARHTPTLWPTLPPRSAVTCQPSASTTSPTRRASTAIRKSQGGSGRTVSCWLGTQRTFALPSRATA
jgi:2-polyprenyl-6-methoxyphenol hydroxylase-like FAD-dependent oxidoreductase